LIGGFVDLGLLFPLPHTFARLGGGNVKNQDFKVQQWWRSEMIRTLGPVEKKRAFIVAEEM
jgi:hypothetical protein